MCIKSHFASLISIFVDGFKIEIQWKRSLTFLGTENQVFVCLRNAVNYTALILIFLCERKAICKIVYFLKWPSAHCELAANFVRHLMREDQ